MTQTIEQLTARVRELEEENARLKETLVDHGEIQKSLCENLYASQAYAEQLREALEPFCEFNSSDAQIEVFLYTADIKKARQALAIPRDTSALDAYVAEKVTEAEARTGNKSPCYQIARDMAVRMWERHYKDDAPNWQPLDDFMGVLSQISNMLTGLGNVEELTRQRDLAVEALQTFIDEHEECTDADDWMAMMCSIEAHHIADEALSTIKGSEAMAQGEKRGV